MSLWSSIAKIAAPIGAVAAAPFTAGTSLAWLPAAIGAGGAALSAGAGASAQNRTAQTDAQLAQDRLRLEGQKQYEDSLIARLDAEMKKRQFDQDSRQAGYRAVLQADALRNFTPAARPKGIPTISFVRAPGAAGQAAAAEMERQAMLRLLNGEQFDPLPALQQFTPAALPKTSTFEKVANILGPGLTVTGSVLDAIRKNRGASV